MGRDLASRPHLLVIKYLLRPSLTIARDESALNRLRSVSIIVTNLLSLNKVLYGKMAHRTMLILQLPYAGVKVFVRVLMVWVSIHFSYSECQVQKMSF